MIIILCLMACAAGFIVKTRINRQSQPAAILIRTKNIETNKRYGQRLK